jgi:Uma2 family endonuclease
MAECRACGVRLGWLLLPAASQARIYRPAALPMVVAGPRVLDGGDVLPGFRLDLGLIWASVL